MDKNFEWFLVTNKFFMDYFLLAIELNFIFRSKSGFMYIFIPLLQV